MSLPKLVATGVLVAAIVSLLVLWGAFFTMWAEGERSIIIYADVFGEFFFEFIALTIAIVFLPVLLYETNELVFGRES